jgi:hypothetical protein
MLLQATLGILKKKKSPAPSGFGSIVGRWQYQQKFLTAVAH